MTASIKTKQAQRVEFFLCPECSGDLLDLSTAFRCRACSNEYEVQGGVPLFTASSEFYDEYSITESPPRNCPGGLKEVILKFLPFWSWREWKFFRYAIPNCDRVLDLGSGRGNQLLTQRAKQVFGVDTSLAFARECAKRYHRVAVCDLPRLPYRDELFDVVSSSHVLGHVANEHKEELTREIRRVLVSGGLTSHIIETDSDHVAVKAAKLFPDSYKRKFVDFHGHIGLEPADAIIERFRRHGFKLLHKRIVDAITPSALNYRGFFQDVPDFANLPGLKAARFLDRLDKSGVVGNLVYEVGMGLFHETAEQWLGRAANAQFVMYLFQKQ